MRGIMAFGLILIFSVALTLTVGCDDNVINGQTRPTLLDINGGMPIYADVFVVQDTISYIPTDVALFRFKNPPSHPHVVLNPDDPNANFVIESYRIEYEVMQFIPSDAVFTPGTLPPITGSMHLILPQSAEPVATEIVMAPATMKLEYPIFDLLPGPGSVAGELLVRADVTFTGHRQSSTEMQDLTGSATILFGDYADETD